jgi:hypothetical protein
MDAATWVIVAGGAALVLLAACYYVPAKTRIIVDTPTSTARAEISLLWGVGPTLTARALPKQAAGNPFASFNDAARVGHAMMTPGLADVVHAALRSLFALNWRTGRLNVGVNFGDNAQNTVVQTAAQAALAASPAPLREAVTVSRREAPGAEVIALFELYASPARLGAIYGRLKNSRAVGEFRKRLTRKIKPAKKPAREVRVS